MGNNAAKPQPAAAKAGKEAREPKATVIEFLPDADEIERSPVPPVARGTLHVLLVALAGFLLWACFSDLDVIVTAKGRLVNPLPNLVVQPLETAIIQKILVRTGQVVKKGEALATLDPTFTQADKSQLRTRFDSLETQARRLEAELLGQDGKADPADPDAVLQGQISRERRANFRAQLDKLEENVARVRASLDTNRRDQVVLGARVRSVRELEAMQEKLVAQQYGARMRLLEAQDKRLEVERELNLARNREKELTSELAALVAEKAAFGKGWRQKMMEDLLAVRRERDSVGEQLAKADLRSKLVTLVAPSDAVVLEIAKLSQGSVVREAESMFTLVPLVADLEAEVQVDAIDVGYIKLNDIAHVKVDAFPFQKHGSLDGKVRTISEDAFRREAGGAGPEAYYGSRIAFGKAQLRNMGKAARLLPGMTLSAEIVVGKRSVMSYLIWPLTKSLTESMREP